MFRFKRRNPDERRGIVIVLAALLMVILLGMAAFGIDIGYMMVIRTQLQLAADAGAMAAGNSFEKTPAEIKQVGIDYVTFHVAGGRPIRPAETKVELGVWDVPTSTFTVTSGIGNAVRVTARRESANFFFGKVLGEKTFNMEAVAIAMANPRDIAFVVDQSGSMNDDTEPAWSTEVIDSEFGSQGFPTAGSDLMRDLYDDFGYGAFPGRVEYIGRPLGVRSDRFAYAEMTKDGGPLAGAALPAKYRIDPSDNERTRKRKCYQWMIDNQIATVMPAAKPDPSSGANFIYWEKYLDYIIQPVSVRPPRPPRPPRGGGGGGGGGPRPPRPPQPPKPPIGMHEPLTPAGLVAFSTGVGNLTGSAAWTQAAIGIAALQSAAQLGGGTPGTPPINRGTLPPRQDGDRIHKFNNPNKTTFPSASSNLPRSKRNLIGYLTYVQFMMDHGRDLRPDGSTHVPLAATSGDCPFHAESTAGGTFNFPPRAQPMHAARRALIAAMDVVDDRNNVIPSPQHRDHVAVITFDTLDGSGPQVHQPLTGNYAAAMQSVTTIQAVGDKAATTATEAGLDLAAKHLLPQSKGGAARDDSEKVVVLLTDGVPNLYISADSDIDSFMGANPSSDFYGGGFYWLDAPLMQATMMEIAGTDMFPVGIGLGTDYDFMDRMARSGGTANSSGASPRGSGNPTEYEQRLIDIFDKIIKKPTARLVQ